MDITTILQKKQQLWIRTIPRRHKQENETNQDCLHFSLPWGCTYYRAWYHKILFRSSLHYYRPLVMIDKKFNYQYLWRSPPSSAGASRRRIWYSRRWIRYSRRRIRCWSSQRRNRSYRSSKRWLRGWRDTDIFPLSCKFYSSKIQNSYK